MARGPLGTDELFEQLVAEGKAEPSETEIVSEELPQPTPNACPRGSFPSVPGPFRNVAMVSRSTKRTSTVRHMTLLGLFLSVLSACTSVVPGRLYHQDGSPLTEQELEALRARRMDQLRPRVSAELDCSAEETDVGCLSEDINGLCLTAHARGCDQSATYVWARTDVGQSQWVMDSARSPR
jgi:hypothetical protein